MIFRQFFLESLGHASYVIGDEGTGRALVFDPQRDVSGYFDFVRDRGLRITHAMDSHGHNDYLSGLTELAVRADVELLGFDGEPDYKLGYPHTPVRDGDVIELGSVTIEVLHTPGHTPEHASLIVRDEAAGDPPALLLSGGALLVGDLARPDLLGGPEEARKMARVYCHTIQERILFQLPEDLEVFPTHVSGSLCGGNIGSRLSTTVGYERKTNAILSRVSSSEGFVDECLRTDNLPAVPPYWRRMRKQNVAGVPALGVLREPPALKPGDFAAEIEAGAVVVDARAPEAYAGGHIPDALNVGLGPAFSTWVGTVVPENGRKLLVLESPDQLWDAAWQLLRTGYDVPVGWLAGGMQAWRTTNRPVQTLAQVSAVRLRELLDAGKVGLLDVRQPAEWIDGHVPGAHFITGAELPDRVGEIQGGRTLAVMCGSGYRSSVAASFIKKQRPEVDVLNVVGGMSAWRAARLPVEGEAGG
ncbi:MAG TPA: MBL fold metallo-hydrolase [Actinomycetota bacterium]|jgi:hydroxyacylglutathione hydrolase|nr:MBL fold metallo-hydrolase [Actinomycetota bacterium]